MTLFYVGPRPVLKGRNSTYNINPYKGTVEKYSNYSIWNPSQVLDGAPNNNHVPGTGRHPGSIMLSRAFQGYEDATQPIKDPGSGTRPTGYRFRPLEYKGLTSGAAFGSSYGHDQDTPIAGTYSYSYSNYKFDGVPTENKFSSYGHAVRAVDATGTAATFGRFDPNDPGSKNVGDENTLESSYGQAIPSGYDNDYGKNKVNEWQGVPSDKAIF